jgi:hypothetical protein
MVGHSPVIAPEHQLLDYEEVKERKQQLVWSGDNC